MGNNKGKEKKSSSSVEQQIGDFGNECNRDTNERDDMEKDGDGEHEVNLLEEETVHPEGGFGWVIVIAAFCVQFMVLGTMNNFTILYVKLLDEFQAGRQETSWIGSITYGIMFFSGPIATSLSERLGCRPVAVIGGVIAAIGTFLASFSNSIFKLYLTEGLLFGIGASLCYFPSLIILPQYFRKKWSLVTGFVTCGSGVGTMAMAPIINVLIKKLGWRVTVRISSLQMVAVALISFLYRPRLPKKPSSTEGLQKQAMFDTSVFRNKAFIAFLVSLSVFMLSYQVPFVHLAQMAVEYGVPMDQASLLMGIMSVFSTGGRLLFGHIADSPRINRLYMYQLAFLAIGVANTICPLLRTFPALVGYCGLFGFFEGCYVCQVAILTGDIVGVESMASGVGIVFCVKSIPLTLGAPIAGALYDVSSSYEVAFYVAGVMPIITACIMFSIPFLMPGPEDDQTESKRHSASKLIKANSVTSLHEGDAVNGSKDMSQMYLSPGRDLANRYLHHRPSISSFNLNMNLEKKVSMRDIGSLSSFGSMILSPSLPSRKSSMLAVSYRPHSRTIVDGRSVPP